MWRPVAAAIEIIKKKARDERPKNRPPVRASPAPRVKPPAIATQRSSLARVSSRRGNEGAGQFICR